ncbi:hypothetical protein T9A_03146 [Alcanivorax jadensis T9]|uniref:Uncharacterized protein n=1 Tax=Alcanivorax jadensis T9 TaxID=1177181 RepID=A0ABR4W8X9_9GAMM|nr:hypothetical protein T9A_03146 [Alcanivorax jadensis T9]MAC14393.1 hypothetical protein [Alcanivorax sp.]
MSDANYKKIMGQFPIGFTHSAASRARRVRHFVAGIVGLFQDEITQLCELCLSPFGSSPKWPTASLFPLERGPLFLQENASHWTILEVTE